MHLKCRPSKTHVQKTLLGPSSGQRGGQNSLSVCWKCLSRNLSCQLIGLTLWPTGGRAVSEMSRPTGHRPNSQVKSGQKKVNPLPPFIGVEQVWTSVDEQVNCGQQQSAAYSRDDNNATDLCFSRPSPSCHLNSSTGESINTLHSRCCRKYDEAARHPIGDKQKYQAGHVPKIKPTEEQRQLRPPLSFGWGIFCLFVPIMEKGGLVLPCPFACCSTTCQKAVNWPPSVPSVLLCAYKQQRSLLTCSNFVFTSSFDLKKAATVVLPPK